MFFLCDAYMSTCAVQHDANKAVSAVLLLVERCTACLDASAHPIIGHSINSRSLVGFLLLLGSG